MQHMGSLELVLATASTVGIHFGSHSTPHRKLNLLAFHHSDVATSEQAFDR